MAVHKLYEAGSITAAWNGVDVAKGVSGDTFLEISPNSDTASPTVGSDGKYAWAKLADQGCTITLTLQMTSTALDDIAKLYFAQSKIGAVLPIAPFEIKDAHDIVHFVALNAVLTQKPTYEFNSGDTINTVQWVWQAESYFLAEDVSTIEGSLNELLNFV
ncbi:hypothetical protein NVP1101O_148 [Vibrio phage 1.101.O._10N.261.45.C6]|nr:hypothetical protein NVP1101O_148 [Vibrio phage 1.101.O._10N.261.45.C6]